MAALVAVLGFTGRSKVIAKGKRRVKTLQYAKIALPTSVVVDAGSVAPKGPVATKGAREPFRKPSRTQPLPPLDWPTLALPPFPALPLVEPPVQPGPSLNWWYLRRLDPNGLLVSLPAAAGAVGAPNEQAPNEGVPPPPAGAAVASDGRATSSQADQNGTDYSGTYDKILASNGSIKWGRVLGADRFNHGELDPSAPLTVKRPFRAPVTIRMINPKKGTVIAERLEWQPDQLESITFASNIRNRIGMMRRRIPGGDTGLSEREAFIARLVLEERQFPDAIDEAEFQARAYIAAAPSSPRGHELLAWVFAQTGQLEKELAVYDELQQTKMRKHAFVSRGLGVLEHRLGLEEEAAKHLEEAVTRGARDPRNFLALSRFRLSRGEAQAALTAAKEARRLIVPSQPKALRHAIQLQLVRTLLAVGDPAASTALAEARNVADLAENRLFEGAVAYAKQQYPEAQAAFAAAGTALPDSAMALIGAGLSAFHAKDYKKAWELFESAARRDPLERHVALAAQGWLLLLTPGRKADALARCRDAERIAPRDPYVLYLLGRAYRENGLFEQARDALDRCLRERYDFVEAMAELAYAQLLEARTTASGLELLADAERLTARAVAGEATRGKNWLYPDLLGIVRYHLGKNDRAAKAFAESREWGGDVHPRLWQALLDNRAGRFEEAVSKLGSVWQQVRDDKNPNKIWAGTTRKRLQYHRGKQAFRDEFNGDRLGKHWAKTQNGQRKIVWRVANGRLEVKGGARRDSPTFVRYTIPRGKDFVEASFQLAFTPGNSAPLLARLHDEQAVGGGKTRVGFELKAGYDGRGGFVYLRDGLKETKKNTTRVFADQNPKLAMQPEQPVHIRIVHDTGVDGSASRGEIVVYWNGVEVARRKARLAASGAGRALYLDFRVEPSLGTKVAGWFDSFRLIRLGE